MLACVPPCVQLPGSLMRASATLQATPACMDGGSATTAGIDGGMNAAAASTRRRSICTHQGDQD